MSLQKWGQYPQNSGLMTPFHGCCWETLYMFAYCGVVVEIPTELLKLFFCSPFNVNQVMTPFSRRHGDSSSRVPSQGWDSERSQTSVDLRNSMKASSKGDLFAVV